MNKSTETMYASGTSLFPRQKTDNLFKISNGCFDYKGVFADNINLVKDNYLLNPKTWQIFVNQFRLKQDSNDRRWRGEYWGKMMRGAVFTYISTGDENLYNLLCETAEDMLTAQSDDGAFTTYESENAFSGWDMWGRKYVMLGFEYFLEICKDKDLSERIIKAVCAHADCILENVGDGDGKKHILETASNWSSVPACTVIEPFVRLFNITQNKKYLEFAEYVIGTGGSSVGNLFELAYKDEIQLCDYPVRKAYEIMSLFEGLLEYYRATGIEKYKTAVLNFARRVMREEITVIGCAGTWHEIFDNAAKYQLNYEHTGIMQETCVTVTWMKICYQLLCLTGDAEFAEHFELSAYNAMLGSVNTEGITESLSGFPFDSYNPLMYGGRARCSSGHNVMGENYDFEYGCCASIGSAGLGLIPITSVLTYEGGFNFNMYIPGKITTLTPNNKEITFDIEANYPKDNKITITLGGDFKENMCLNFRIPSYCKSAIIELNDDGELLMPKLGGYYTVFTEWKNGNKIELTFDNPVRTFRCEGPKNYGDYHTALFKGPVVLARDARFGDGIDEPADILENPDGTVNAVECNDADFSTNLLYNIPTKDGGFIKVTDYSSAGKTWDNKSLLTVWISSEKYWNVDLTRPVYIQSINYTDMNYMTDRNGSLRWCEKERNKAYRWRIVPEGDYCYIKSPDGRCITANINGIMDCDIRLEEPCGRDNQLWKIEKFIQDKYQIISKESACHLHEIRWDREQTRYTLFAFDKNADERFNGRKHVTPQSSKSINECIFKFSND
ncbi:MAG: glycoside hydrolase family 127 protein [Clostridia bacterium]|nr:glycoside hydrolase family 127 protein [Clostridia bacterium]